LGPGGARHEFHRKNGKLTLSQLFHDFWLGQRFRERNESGAFLERIQVGGRKIRVRSRPSNHEDYVGLGKKAVAILFHPGALGFEVGVFAVNALAGPCLNYHF
jgi:hypothetical protein